VPKNITLIFLPSRSPELNRRADMAIHPRKLALKPRLRHLRRDHRCRLRRLEQARRTAAHHHVNRYAPLGLQRSSMRALGIRCALN
jgi:hypothetical protein